MIIKQATNYTRMFLMVQSSDHITGLTSASPVVKLSKAGAAFATAAGTVAEVGGAGNGNGFYTVALTIVDTGTTGDLAYHITAASGDPTDFVDQIQATWFSDLNLDANGNVGISSNIKKNTAQNNFMFVMTDNVLHKPATGLTVSSFRSIDGGAFAATANSVTELANGWYAINFASSDTNGNHIALRFTATGADDLNLEEITQP